MVVVDSAADPEGLPRLLLEFIVEANLRGQPHGDHLQTHTVSSSRGEQVS